MKTRDLSLRSEFSTWCLHFEIYKTVIIYLTTLNVVVNFANDNLQAQPLESIPNIFLHNAK